MHHFTYRQGVGGGSILHAEDLSLADLADSVGTPFYCYSTATLERHYRVFADAFEGLDAEVCYSVKANSNLAVLATLVLIVSFWHTVLLIVVVVIGIGVIIDNLREILH